MVTEVVPALQDTRRTIHHPDEDGFFVPSVALLRPSWDHRRSGL